jgi:N-acyl-D-amino-acid deacylase
VPQVFDTVIAGATIYAGDTAPIVGDVGIRGGSIAAVEPRLVDAAAREIVDGDGLWLCPGFIDLHAHSALEPFSNPSMVAKVSQGFTTEVLHPDGLAPAPVKKANRCDRRAYLRGLEGTGPADWTWESFDEYLDALQIAGSATNLVPSVGHNAVRDAVMGPGKRRPARADLRAMKDLVRQGFESGARALSFGLIYLPGVYSTTDELIELAKEAARFELPLVPHVRNEGTEVLSAHNEMIEVARLSGAPLHISHLKVIGIEELVEPVLGAVQAAAENQAITFDQYPYGAGSTVLTAVLPPWALEGGPHSILRRLSEKAELTRIRNDVSQGIPGWENVFQACGAHGITIAHAAASCEQALGQSLADLGDRWGLCPLDAALHLLRKTELDVTMITQYASEDIVRRIYQHDLALVGSDGIFGLHPHPRLFGTAGRVLGRYAIRERLVSPQNAIARLTWRAADLLRLADRGRIREGLRADLVLLDPREFIDMATYADPVIPCAGVRRTYVAGRPVWVDGAATGELPGEVVRDSAQCL